MKKYLYFFSTIAATFIIGCGNGSSVSDTQFNYNTSSIFGYSNSISYKNYLVEAVDDPIVKAIVKASNCQTFEEIGDGKYMLEKCVGKPMYIEIKNGIIETKDGNVTQNFPLLLNVAQSEKEDDFIVTPLTTLLVNANENNISILANKLGVSEDDLYNADNENIKKILPKINTVLIKSAMQGAIANKIKFLDTVREAIIESDNIKDFNISKVIETVHKESIQNPNLFGLVIISENNDINNSDPLQSLVKMQTRKSITFYGLVFDKMIADASIIIKDLDNNVTYSDTNVTADEYGAWTMNIDENNTKDSLYYTIMNENHLLQFIATKKEGNKTIKLTSTITTKKLRELLKDKTKTISPTKDNSLIISNITTAQDALLDKEGALNSKSYESNLSNLKVYYQDKVLQLAAVIKAVVDQNVTTTQDYNDTYELATNTITTTSNGDIDVNTSVVDANITQIEENITNNTILTSQLNSVNKDINNTFQEVAQNHGYTFYRLLAYYKQNKPKTEENFVREYTKIIVYPGYYETQTCYLDGNSTSQWNCDNPIVTKDNSNFTLGTYEVNKNDEVIKYSLDFNNSIYVKYLNKNYNYYGVIQTDMNLTSGITKTEPMILVDSYDVVDAFRRIAEKDQDFKNLQDEVKKYNSKEEVNFAINRWVKNYIDEVSKYFSNNN